MLTGIITIEKTPKEKQRYIIKTNNYSTEMLTGIITKEKVPKEK